MPDDPTLPVVSDHTTDEPLGTSISYSEARSRLAQVMAQVCTTHQPVTILHKSQPPVVVVALADYEAMQRQLQANRPPAWLEEVKSFCRDLRF